MTTRYFSADGTEYTKSEIIAAYNDGRCAITTSRAEWHNVDALHVRPDAETADDIADTDTRGACYSMWDETWGRSPQSAEECLKIAGVRMPVYEGDHA